MVQFPKMAATQEKCDVVDSWEDIDESELVARSFPSQPDCRIQMSSVNGQMVVEEDSVRTQYTAPQPSVTILKRPSKGEDGCHDSLVNGEVKSGKSSKGRSLQQRKIDYAEARLRIMGEAKSPEDDLDERLSQMTFVGSSGSSGANQTPTPSGMVTLLRPTDASNVVRLPKGPDGSPGFSLKR